VECALSNLNECSVYEDNFFSFRFIKAGTLIFMMMMIGYDKIIINHHHLLNQRSFSRLALARP